MYFSKNKDSNYQSGHKKSHIKRFGTIVVILAALSVAYFALFKDTSQVDEIADVLSLA